MSWLGGGLQVGMLIKFAGMQVFFISISIRASLVQAGY